MDLPARTRLEQRVHEAHLSIEDFVKQFAEAAQSVRESATTSKSQALRWLAGTSRPYPASRRVLASWFGEPIEVLLGPPRALSVSAMSPATSQEWIMQAGRESTEHARAAASSVSPSVLEQLHVEAQRAARDYLTTPSTVMLQDLVVLRNDVYEQLNKTRKPRQQAELYLLAGQVCGLLASVAWDLGYPDVAEDQARSAYIYGTTVDHPSLQAWARALQVTIVFWSGSPRRAVKLASDALHAAPTGTPSARLQSVHARALSMIGARDEVDAALNAAADELDRAGDDWADEIGGELAFGRSRHALCAGASYVRLGDGDRAETAATRAIELFAMLPAQARWSAGELGALVDLGTARTLRGDLAGAEDALRSVFAIGPEWRTEALSRRLLNLGQLLGVRRFHGSIEARRLGEQVEDFTSSSLARVTARPALAPGV
ncbi:hypothetical protein [Kutzneria albida]|uniref:XRE family transcriptional regulator n=1 Tax=Kutzneria albida DSM 43870 TaxID=1449976 RepID=W5WCE9_9PSEU|nr:hypothetical protein [Kutzneria albida]AHH98196.1 hypothetical protein KALB_4834 [Kutzneria albida DSM 43870]